MPLRIAFDLDGVLADMGAALTREERRLMGVHAALLRPLGIGEGDLENALDEGATVNPVIEEMQSHGLTPAQQKVLWQSVAQTRNFWETLAEIEPGGLRSLNQLARELRWEIIFLTKRPKTAGDTAQIQTQRWLERHGFQHPSVFVVDGSRGKVADALALDCVVDDVPANCTDVLSDSKAKPILVWRGPPGVVPARARRLGIRVVRSMAECLDVLVAQEDRAHRRAWKKVVAALRPPALIC
jgi:hypothetical protein